ncbi:ubiquitin ligase [Fusarium heterosporum]|uniref:Ubiquitin ligase n=1 Tax=Fusarium heterosporum TaxID=42747 RepID=A0A8H5TMT6_FUSHE|nr:ubiquitin ligase [Fusarium heterosporum]
MTSFLALSQTLGGITNTKIGELEKQRTIYEARKDKVLDQANQEDDSIARINLLLEGVRNLNAEAYQSPAVKNIKHWLSQSKYDVSVPAESMQAHEDLIRSHLEVPSRKLALGHLYARLITEWMTSVSSEPAQEEESFEVLDQQKERLQQLCDKFEQVVFEPLQTDEVEIDLYLNELFQGDRGEESAKSLKSLREAITNSCGQIFGAKAPFDSATLKWCINGLLAEDLLSDEKQAILRDFLEKPVVLGEIADVLNMRFSNIHSWEWDAGEHGIPVLPRQQLNGKYRIWMDEDVLQAILIHYIGIKCCVALKSALHEFISSSHTIWKWHAGPEPTHDEKLRRTYYMTSGADTKTNLSNERKGQYTSTFFMSQLPATVETIGSGGYSDPTEEQEKSKQPNIKQRLLQTLATEATIHKTLKGEVALIQTDLEWFATGLPHSTIFAAMRFFGFTESAISFFKKALEAPLNVQSSPDSLLTGSPRVRRRGVPMAHAPEKLLGELVLFIMDVVVNQQDGMLLYRLHDDLWLCGEPLNCKRAWAAMNDYAKILGLSFNKSKTGSVYIASDSEKRDTDIASALPEGPVRVGHLALDPVSGIWEIDHEEVERHMKQLKKQLKECGSVLEWVQTWNSCMGRFFSHTFGEPAHCFGLHHVDSILETYQMMQKFLFSDVSDSIQGSHGAVNHVKSMINDRFGVVVPDAFVHLPERLGGLGLRNPFVPILTVRESLGKESPELIIRELHDKMMDRYKKYKKHFDNFSVEFRIAAAVKASWILGTVHSDVFKNLLSAQELNTFFSMEEHAKHLELTSSALTQAYLSLQTVPYAVGPDMDSDVSDTLNHELNLNPNDASSKVQEARWALQMYRDELRRDYGGLRLVEKEHLPLGVLTLLRNRAVTWTMVL